MVDENNQARQAQLLPPSLLNKLERVAKTCDTAGSEAQKLFEQLTKIIKLKTVNVQGPAMFLEATEAKKTIDNLDEICKALPVAIEEMQELREEIQNYLLPEIALKSTFGIGNNVTETIKSEDNGEY